MLKISRDTKISKNFRLGEFISKNDINEITLNWEIVHKLEILRLWLQAPITINSAYRSPNHNKKVGGSPKSQHLLGNACDIKVKGYTPYEAGAYAKKLGFTGVGIYNTFTHIDLRPKVSYFDYTTNKNGWDLANKVKLRPYPLILDDFKNQTVNISLNNKTLKFDGVAKLIDGKMEQYIRVKDLEALGYNVGWNSEKRVVEVIQK